MMFMQIFHWFTNRAVHSRGGSQRALAGQASMETALVLIAFIPLLMGSIDFARVFYDQINVTNLAREGARKASICQNTTTVTTAVQNAAVITQVASVTVTAATTTFGQASVTVTANFTPITPIAGAIIGTRTLTATSYQYQEATNTSC